MRFLHKLSLSKKILLGILPLFMIFVTVSVIFQNRFQEQQMLDEVQEAAVTCAEIMKEAMVSMMVNNLEVDSTFLLRLNDLKQFDTVHVLRNDLHLRPELMLPGRTRRLESEYRTFIPSDDIERNVLASGQSAFETEGERFRAVIPFTATDVCQRCHAVPVGYTLGAADIHISLSPLAQAAAQNWTRSIAIFFMFSIIVVAAASFMFAQLVAKPIGRLARATKEIGDGHLDYEIPGFSSGEVVQTPAGFPPSDDLSFLALRFDHMRLSLRDKIHQIDEMNRRLVDRNEELEDALTRLRKAQEELVRAERLAATGWMSAQLSHEINNPIHNIQSLLELSLRRVPESGDLHDLVSVALEEVTKMAKLTREMLSYFRGTVMTDELVPVDPVAFLRGVVAASREEFSGHAVDFRADIPKSLPLICADQGRLRQVLLNMIVNARDAITPPGRIDLRAEEFGDRIRISIADTGRGIPAEDLDRIFDPFFTTKEEMSGVGLGLFISYGIVQQHHGTILVKSTPGKGSTFAVELPIAGGALQQDIQHPGSIQSHA